MMDANETLSIRRTAPAAATTRKLARLTHVPATPVVSRWIGTPPDVRSFSTPWAPIQPSN